MTIVIEKERRFLHYQLTELLHTWVILFWSEGQNDQKYEIEKINFESYMKIGNLQKIIRF